MIKLPELYNRKSKKIELENAYKVEGLAFLYGSLLGKAFTHSILNKHFVSKLYGRRVKSKRSTAQIPGFIKHYNINTEEIKEPLDSFPCFNDFFIRELKDGSRVIDTTSSHLISPADSRLLVIDLSKSNSLPVKGYWYSLKDLLKDKELEQEFADGLCFIYRLAPNDYHRYSYFDNGRHDKVRKIRGVLHSVNPIALRVTKSLMAKNYRELTVLQSENFGKVLQLEVGALLVGKIIQHHYDEHTFTRGEEKGYFEFGGSTVIQLFKKGVVKLDSDIEEYSLKQIETLVKLGEKVGVAHC